MTVRLKSFAVLAPHVEVDEVQARRNGIDALFVAPLAPALGSGIAIDVSRDDIHVADGSTVVCSVTFSGDPAAHRSAMAKSLAAAVEVAVEQGCSLVVVCAQIHDTPSIESLRAHGTGLIEGFASAPAVPIDRAYPAPAF
jgi:hypothetical protein